MPLTPAVMLALASQCAPTVAPETLVSVARVESAFDPLAIGVNGAEAARIHPKSVADAVGTAAKLIADGANIDLGLGQINSSNLGWLGLTVAEAFDPCRNLRAAGQVLQQAYVAQAPSPGHEQAALRVALSIYNTGHADRGFKNGYVARVTSAAAIATPASRSASPTPQAPSWDVFASAQGAIGFVFTPALPGDLP